MHWLTLLISILVLAPANRIRGGFGGDAIRHELGYWWRGRVASSISWGIPFGVVSLLLMPWQWALIMGIGAAIGCGAGQGGPLAFVPQAWVAWVPSPLRECLFGRLSGLSMGHRPGGAVGIAAWCGLASWGILRLLLPALTLWWLHMAWWPLLVAGALCPVVYEAVWHVPAWCLFRGGGYGDGPETGYDRPELAEWLWPVLVGLALAA